MLASWMMPSSSPAWTSVVPRSAWMPARAAGSFQMCMAAAMPAASTASQAASAVVVPEAGVPVVSDGRAKSCPYRRVTGWEQDSSGRGQDGAADAEPLPADCHIHRAVEGGGSPAAPPFAARPGRPGARAQGAPPRRLRPRARPLRAGCARSAGGSGTPARSPCPRRSPGSPLHAPGRRRRWRARPWPHIRRYHRRILPIRRRYRSGMPARATGGCSTRMPVTLTRSSS